MINCLIEDIIIQNITIINSPIGVIIIQNITMINCLIGDSNILHITSLATRRKVLKDEIMKHKMKKIREMKESEEIEIGLILCLV